MKLLKTSGKNVSDVQSVVEDRKYLLWSNNEFFLRESFKTLRTNVTFALADTDGCKVIAVTSGMQGEGKSTIAANLAMSFVDLGKRVLIVDCDLRRPKLATLLECQTSNGLTNAFIDLTMLKPAIVRYSGGNLDVLPCGSIPPNPSELLGSERMMQLLELLRSRYDYIVVDLPPVIAVLMLGAEYTVSSSMMARRRPTLALVTSPKACAPRSLKDMEMDQRPNSLTVA